MKTIAVDFDGVLHRGKWPEIGEANEHVLRSLIREQEDGAKLILWTCREGNDLMAAVMWCMNHDLRFDAVNDNLAEHKERFGNNCRKVCADEYWDDRAVIVHGDAECSAIMKRKGNGYHLRRWMRTKVKIRLKERMKAWWVRWHFV